MLKNYLVQRRTSLESGRSSIAFERAYWKIPEALAYEDGWHNWRDFFYVNGLPNKPDGMPLASHVRKTLTAFLFPEYDKGRG
jgi:hypothetical protein